MSAERAIDIEAKLIALLELSKSEAVGTQHEAKLALETAIRLAAKHGISLSKLAEKRRGYAGNWFAGVPETQTVEFTDERYTEFQLRKWCELVEAFGWERYQRSSHEKEGLIFMYRIPNRDPKLEVRIFERPWGDVEFEVVKNPDPILGNLDAWTKMGIDMIEWGVTYQDCKEWVEADHRRRINAAG